MDKIESPSEDVPHQYNQEEAEVLILETQKSSQLENISSENERLTLDKLRKTPYNPLTHLAKVEEKIGEQARLNNELELQTNLLTYKITQPKGTKFCPLLNHPNSNCNSKQYYDGNCFETKTPGCRDGKIYLALKKLAGKKSFPLSACSYISKTLDFILPRKE